MESSADQPGPKPPRGPVPARQRLARPGVGAPPIAQMPRPSEAEERHDQWLFSLAPRVLFGLGLFVIGIVVVLWFLGKDPPEVARGGPPTLAERMAANPRLRVEPPPPVPPSDLEVEAAIDRGDWDQVVTMAVARVKAGLPRPAESIRLLGLLRDQGRLDGAEALLAALPPDQRNTWDFSRLALDLALLREDKALAGRRWLELPFGDVPVATRETLLLQLRDRLFVGLPLGEIDQLVPDPFPGGNFPALTTFRIGALIASGQTERAREVFERDRGSLPDARVRLLVGDFALLAEGGRVRAEASWSLALDGKDPVVAAEVLDRALREDMPELAAGALGVMRGAGLGQEGTAADPAALARALMLVDDFAAARAVLERGGLDDAEVAAHLEFRIVLMTRGLDQRQLTALGLLADRRADLPEARATEVLALASRGRVQAAESAWRLLDPLRGSLRGGWRNRELDLAWAAVQAMRGENTPATAARWTPAERELLVRAGQARRP